MECTSTVKSRAGSWDKVSMGHIPIVSCVRTSNRTVSSTTAPGPNKPGAESFPKEPPMHPSLSFAEESGIVAGSLGMIPTRRSDPSRHLRPAWLNFVDSPSGSPSAKRTPSPSSASRPFSSRSASSRHHDGDATAATAA